MVYKVGEIGADLKSYPWRKYIITQIGKISLSMIELLESDSVPLVKKRMTMKQSFGDYRKLMK